MLDNPPPRIRSGSHIDDDARVRRCSQRFRVASFVIISGAKRPVCRSRAGQKGFNASGQTAITGLTVSFVNSVHELRPGRGCAPLAGDSVGPRICFPSIDMPPPTPVLRIAPKITAPFASVWSWPRRQQNSWRHFRDEHRGLLLGQVSIERFAN